MSSYCIVSKQANFFFYPNKQDLKIQESFPSLQAGPAPEAISAIKINSRFFFSCHFFNSIEEAYYGKTHNYGQQ